MQLTTMIHPYLAEVLRAVGLVLELDEPASLLHARRVAILASLLAERALPEERNEIFCAGLLHDVGAVGMTERLFSNPLLAHHPIDHDIDGHAWRSAGILASAAAAHPTLRPSPCLVLDHHEWWDGRGYPAGKFGAEISLGAQFIRIADSLALIMHNGLASQARTALTKLSRRAGKEFSEEVFHLLEEVADQELYRQLSDIRGGEELAETEICGLQSPGAPIACELDPAADMLVQMLEAKHSYITGHSKRVAIHCRRVACTLGLTADEIRLTYLTGLLHDVGKVAIPREILKRPGPLSKEEWELVQKHPLFNEAILRELGALDEVRIATRHVHERWDGSGYPDGIAGDEIPLASRIVSVCDTFEGMTSHRPYRPRANLTEALEELSRAGGSQFDPVAVDAAAAVVLDQLFLN